VECEHGPILQRGVVGLFFQPSLGEVDGAQEPAAPLHCGYLLEPTALRRRPWWIEA
jgi:hypothetical protein